MKALTFLFYGLTVFLITSREILWFRLIAGNQIHNLIVAIGFLFYFIGLFFHLSREKGLIFNPGLRWNWKVRFGRMAPLVLLLGFFLVGHELFIGQNGRSFKFFTYFIFFLTLISNNIDLRSVARFCVYLGVLISSTLILQFALSTFVYPKDLETFTPIEPDYLEGRNEVPYVNPLGLGLLRKGEKASYGGFSFYRGNGYSTESKYCSIVLWVCVLSLLFLSYFEKVPQARLWMILIGLGLFISHSYTSAAVVLMMFFVSVKTRYRHIKILGVIACVLGFSVLVFTKGIPFVGYAGERLNAFWVSTLIPLKDFPWNELTLTGLGYDSPFSNMRMPTLLLQWVRYGHLGFLFYGTLLYLLLSACTEGAWLSDSKTARRAFGLAFAIVFCFLMLFLSELVTPLYCYVFALTITLLGEIKNKGLQAKLVPKVPSENPERIALLPAQDSALL